MTDGQNKGLCYVDYMISEHFNLFIFFFFLFLFFLGWGWVGWQPYHSIVLSVGDRCLLLHLEWTQLRFTCVFLDVKWKKIIPEVTVEEFLALHQHRFEPQSTAVLPKCMWQITLWKIYQPQPKVASQTCNKRTLSRRSLTRSFRHFINTGLSQKYSCASKTHVADYAEASDKTDSIELWKIYQHQPKMSS